MIFYILRVDSFAQITDELANYAKYTKRTIDHLQQACIRKWSTNQLQSLHEIKEDVTLKTFESEFVDGIVSGHLFLSFHSLLPPPPPPTFLQPFISYPRYSEIR